MAIMAMPSSASRPPATLAVTDYFAMYNTVQESGADEDLGSGGAHRVP